MKAKIFLFLVVIGVVIFYFVKRKRVVAQDSEQEMQISSSAFKLGEPIPAKYTCDGSNVSPPVSWSHIPAATKSLVLICADPDAPMGTFVHWIVFNIDASIRSFNENEVPSGCVQGENDFGKIGYGGPCPPTGPAHRYFFKLYALPKTLNLKEGVKKEEIIKAMDSCGKLSKNETFYGIYSR
jgi:Raf kinase inhibitor-like YbhB/YbcL family protein